MHCETRLCDPEYPEDPIRFSSEHAARKKPVWSLTPADGRRGSIAINLGLMQVKQPQIIPRMTEMWCQCMAYFYLHCGYLRIVSILLVRADSLTLEVCHLYRTL